jgi:dethiobiotin synthetase
VTNESAPDLLVTGTDTGVGKTVVAAAVTLARRGRGLRVVAYKPVESGVADGAPSDAAVLSAACGAGELLSEPVLQLGEPLAPAVAADRAGIVLGTDTIEERIAAMRARGWSLVIEGAGGLLVPLSWGYTALDLAERAGLAAIVVARAGLGTLNHTQLTVEALTRRGVPVRAVVLNQGSDHPDLAEATNPAALERLLPGIPVVLVPHHDVRDTLDAARRSVSMVAGL